MKKKAKKLAYIQGQTCFICQEKLRPKEATLDHLIPVSLGGKGATTVAVHQKCNQEKGNRLPTEDEMKRFFELKRQQGHDHEFCKKHFDRVFRADFSGVRQRGIKESNL